MIQTSGAWSLDVTPERIGILTIDLPGEKVNRRRQTLLADDRAVFRDETTRDLGSADVDSDGMHERRV